MAKEQRAIEHGQARSSVLLVLIHRLQRRLNHLHAPLEAR
jgi:hypothetical protein